ncbi:3-oxoadipate enol-lactonase [Rhodococcus sp. BP-252]|uniref:3-oxoadipate enol-lactonase n=1 Tax=unclassified Rhodococcus (in: high G+C Gram-positive bacteria) TaxID=192944 RepID=UPI001C9AAAE2|nr:MULTISPECIES: 3-oxoadipate enol-lactonase [unclassified Rhodococcus (in: high G+C Gram-positive bacteria)]MBY6412804.1 3-oxoadipate enol-lactonase [Rhodococcus sp. BP-320]MBY6417659.1 3-oxoadipate enol-lactonase [Rhodococcus sp. BP-321]MBY6423511.1 3-oxoadipate enol-lactonase [Rhodococcus sp. BP-324]MBY6427683.1 3-oxoadipate enol-lactonase [Rhodococcus sp. BP-323]MBY6432847.1 3-oxoadipate enol-lactonase [Rhodococcus sp. BP-322]
MTVELSYDLVAATSPTTQTVVFIGSLGSTRSMWDAQVEALSDHLDVIAVDLRGHGTSPVSIGPYTVAELADDVLALLDSLGREHVHLVGLSLGGAIAQWISVHRPERVASLTLLCTSARFGDPQGWIDRAATVRDHGTRSIADAVLERWFTVDFGESVDAYRNMIASTSDEGYAACCEALAGWDNRADLGNISSPTLVIAGKEDPATTPADMAVIADGIPRAEFHVLSPAAHLANVEQYEQVSRLLKDHIGRAENA